ncbi:MAG: hypothetical protein KAQ71_14095, partial [Desulfobulbaceae bacterium]|nr:hypothetical protein [Desulfobulbaceae bacterium]
MKLFVITLICSFTVLILVPLLINFCRKRLRKTPHGLTGMCHQTGGSVCDSCQDKVTKSSTGVVQNRN